MQRHRQLDDLISLLLFCQNKENFLTTAYKPTHDTFTTEVSHRKCSCTHFILNIIQFLNRM
jgi:hypothetical protein